ncbi:transcription initiation factor IIB [Naganishia albida]|nr:transcription initiation factor IIB [Naganishia albida]
MSSPMAKQALSNSLSTVPPSSSSPSSAGINPYINTISFGAGAASAMYGQAGVGKKAKADESYRQDLNIRLMCKNCRTDPPNIIEETANGDLVCGDCGLVLGDRVVDTRSEWRTFANDEGPDQSRVGVGPSGNAQLEGIEDFGTEIAFRDGHSGLAKALQKTQRSVIGQGSANRRDHGFALIQEYCSKMNVSRVISDTAKQIYLRVEEVRDETGKNNLFARGSKGQDAVAGTCIFLACKHNQVSRSMKEMCELCGIAKRDFAHSYKLISGLFREDMLNGRLPTLPQRNGQVAPPSAARDLLPRFCNRLAISPRYESAARTIIETASQSTAGIVDGRSPISVAAGTILFVCMLFGLPPTLKDVSEVAQVSEGTVKLVTKILARHKELLTKKEWLDSKEASFDRLPVTDPK